MVIELIPNLKTALVEPAQAEPVVFGDFVVPEAFSVWFVFTDPKDKAREWDLFFNVVVSDLGTPKLDEVSIKGCRSSNLLKVERDGVERWQLKVAEQYRTQLLTLALRIAIETRFPTVMLRRELTAENSATLRALTQAGSKPNQRVLEHPSTITGKLPRGEVADFVRFWDGNPEPLDQKQLKTLQQLIGKKIRQKINNQLLAKVAQIYNEEGSRIGGKPVKAIQVQLGGSYRTAQDYVRKAREEGYLPTTTAGKVTTKQTRARKGKDDGKK